MENGCFGLCHGAPAGIRGVGVAPFALAAQTEMPLEATHLRCEYRIDPLGMDVAKPGFSWELSTAEKG